MVELCDLLYVVVLLTTGKKCVKLQNENGITDGTETASSLSFSIRR